MIAPIVLRPFARDDAETLTELIHRAYAPLAAAGLNFTGAYQDVAATLRRASGGLCLVAELDGELVGTVTMSSPPSRALQRLAPGVAGRKDTVWLNQLAVDPSHQGEGIAGRLWDEGCAWAVRNGVEWIGIDTAESAEHLVDLYRRWGFEPVETIHWDGKTYNSIVMVLAVG
ncbi:MAG TPA: GNAT family N-acetyltransferase [Lacisediminihabitans sp.]|uniref:GNAT family N-acetyltransferase n=1 Tax=Lacisediminihabitans sp. TaxID=2787631 RepID=UPI002EDA9FF3